MDSTHLTEDETLLFVNAMRLNKEGMLPDNLREHLENCEQCRLSVFEYLQFDKLESPEPPEIHPALLDKPISKKILPLVRKFQFLKYAAALGLIMVSASVLIFWLRPDPSEVIAKLHKVSDHYKDQVLSHMESQIEQHPVLRYTGFQLLRPNPNEIFQDTAIFSWESRQIDSVRIKIINKVNEQETRVFTIPAAMQQLKLSEIGSDSLYYYKVTYIDGRLEKPGPIGRFYVTGNKKSQL